MSQEVIGTVIASISKIKNISRESIGMDSNFEQLKMDSLDGLDLLFELEEAFDLTIPDEKARSFHTVHAIVEEIEKMLLESNRRLPAQS